MKVLILILFLCGGCVEGNPYPYIAAGGYGLGAAYQNTYNAYYQNQMLYQQQQINYNLEQMRIWGVPQR